MSEQEVLIREVPVEVGGDGRTLEARIVPWDTPTTVVDLPENGGTGIPYTESWDRKSFDKQTGVAHRVKVWLNFEHERGLRGIVGHAIELVSRKDALYGTFRLHEDSDGEKARHMVATQVLSGISLEAKALSSKEVDGVVVRTRAHLDKVSLCRLGAYEDAQVLALRESPPDDEIPDPDPEPQPTPTEPSEAAQALARVGYEPLLTRAVTRKPWNGSPARFEDDEYARSCLIDRGGDAPVKERCSLPVLEPNGDVNANALPAAAAVLSGARGGLKNVSAADKSKAARKLVRLYAQAEMEPPDSLKAVASR